MSPELEITTRIGYSFWPRWTRSRLRASSGSPIDIWSISKVFFPTITASPSERISSNRCLSKAEVKPDGVCLAVETLPSTVMAKFKMIRGRCIKVNTSLDGRLFQGNVQRDPNLSFQWFKAATMSSLEALELSSQTIGCSAGKVGIRAAKSIIPLKGTR